MKQKKQQKSVDEFMVDLEHPMKNEIEAVRRIILGSNTQITEQIKWNAPSFCINGDDRITFRLNPPKDVQLIFHRGAKVRTDVNSFSFADPSGLIKWITKDRGTVTFQDMNSIISKENDLRELADKWVRETIE